MATPAQFIEQQSAQRHQNAAQQKESLDLLQRQFLAKQYEQYANNIPLPDAKTDPEGYKKALDLRREALESAQKVYAPDHHATLGEHLHGLIFGQKQPQNSPVPVSASAPSLQPAGATAPAASPTAAPAPPPDHPFAHHPGYAAILDGLKGLESRLKGAVNPNPQANQKPPSLADFAAVPTNEDLARSSEAQKQKDAVTLEKMRADATIEAAKIRANAAAVSTPEKAFLNRFALSQGADDYASLTPEQQTQAVMAWKKANAGPVHMQLKPINGWLEQYNPVTGEMKKIAKLDQVTVHTGVHYITNALTGEITEVPYTTYTRKDTGQPIESEGDSGQPTPPKSSQALTFPATGNLPQQPSGTLNPYSNPEYQPPQRSFAFNRNWAKPGPYATKLSPPEEREFQEWVRANKVPWQDTPTADYDMRGYWKALNGGKAKQTFNAWDHTMHFPDTWKTPYSGTFSRESIYAKPNAPHWQGDKLVTSTDKVVTDETPKKPVSSKAPNLAHVNNNVATANAGSKKLNKGKPVSSKAPKIPGAHVVGHTASLLDKSDATQYTKLAEDANNKKVAYESAKKALTSPTASSDQELIYSWVRSNVQGAGRMTQAEFRQAAAVGSLPQRAQIWYERTKTGKLPPSIEQMMFADIKRSYETAENEANDIRSRLGGNTPTNPTPQPGSGFDWSKLPDVTQ